MTAHEAFSDLSQSLAALYDRREATNIADWAMESITGKKRWERRMEKVPLTVDELNLFNKYKSELLTNKPIQYVLNEAFFCGYKFILNENVLIPRPETEELVQRIADENIGRGTISILDIGTGSGCIPVSLKKKLPEAHVTSIDISPDAVKTATQNARALFADIEIKELDFLNELNWKLLGYFDVVVSNPPYISVNEKSTLNKNVADFEPGAALFVPNNDPLIFYNKIEKFCRSHLKKEGKIYLEVNEKYAEEVLKLFIEKKWVGKIVKDMHDKRRMVVVGESNEQ